MDHDAPDTPLQAAPAPCGQAPDWLRHMESILETLNEGILIIDSQLHVIFANEALVQLGGYERNEMLGRTPETVFPPEDVPYLMRQRELGLRTGRSRHEFYFPRKDGERIPVIFSGRIIRGPDGQDYVLLVVTDIRAQKRVEEQLRAANARLEKRQREIEAELLLAARVQESLAPRSLVWNDVTIEAHYIAARSIGGDFGVVFPHNDQRLSLLVCDVSGHGIGSALVANRIYSESVHELEQNTGPSKLLRRLHDFVNQRIAADGFYFTMAAGRFVEGGRHMTFAGAGHPPAMLVSSAGVRRLRSQSGILGSLPDAFLSESTYEINLASGDRVLFYTDGLTEVFNPSDEMFGVDRLEELVRQSAKQPLPEMKQSILDGVAGWRNGPLTDDLSLVLVELR
ncbi:MAG TPA: SpoIIE family protein phosphatase [Verrucomicrobiae bacterium]|nr:SpoIIE family protein phosphatase [Verrucomicrobiae bacterium]